MTFFHAFILGIVEGVTEFLPVSSTAHIVLASKLLGLVETEFLKSFTIIIQLGAILAVCVLFFKLVWERKNELIPRVLAAFIPTVVIGFVLYKVIKGYLIGNIFISGIALVAGGIVFLVLEYWWLPRNTKPALSSYPNIAESAGFGLAQALAVIPGVSRSGTLIVYGLLRGYSREIVITFAFLLAVPTMLAASVYDLYKTSAMFTPLEWQLLIVGFVVSFFVAYAVSKWFIRYISKNTFKLFGWYRIVVGSIVIFWSLY